jgi:hypothetical protein
MHKNTRNRQTPQTKGSGGFYGHWNSAKTLLYSARVLEMVL